MIWVRICNLSLNLWELKTNEAKILAILEALRIVAYSFHGLLIDESDSTNFIHWVSNGWVVDRFVSQPWGAKPIKRQIR